MLGLGSLSDRRFSGALELLKTLLPGGIPLPAPPARPVSPAPNKAANVARLNFTRCLSKPCFPSSPALQQVLYVWICQVWAAHRKKKKEKPETFSSAVFQHRVPHTATCCYSAPCTMQFVFICPTVVSPTKENACTIRKIQEEKKNSKMTLSHQSVPSTWLHFKNLLIIAHKTTLHNVSLFFIVATCYIMSSRIDYNTPLFPQNRMSHTSSKLATPYHMSLKKCRRPILFCSLGDGLNSSVILIHHIHIVLTASNCILFLWD